MRSRPHAGGARWRQAVRRWLLAALVLVFCVVPRASAGDAGSFPARPIRLIAPVSAGGGADVAARMLAKSMSETLQTQFVVDNRPGGGSVPGTAAAAAATPDGYTLLWVSGAHAINAAFNRALPYDAIKSFTPVALFARMPLILVVHPGVPAKTAAELIALARRQPGKLNFASSGTGSASHLAFEMLKLHAEIDMVNVSYKGAAPSIAGLMGGEVQLAMLGPLSVKPHVAAGKLRPLAVTTAARSSAFPGLPTLAESGVAAYDFASWYGILAPQGVPAPVVERLASAIVGAQRDKRVIDLLGAEGAELPSVTPAQFASYLRAEIAKYADLGRRLNLKLE